MDDLRFLSRMSNASNFTSTKYVEQQTGVIVTMARCRAPLPTSRFSVVVSKRRGFVLGCLRIGWGC